jgi:hypothetical protein
VFLEAADQLILNAAANQIPSRSYSTQKEHNAATEKSRDSENAKKQKKTVNFTFEI